MWPLVFGSMFMPFFATLNTSSGNTVSGVKYYLTHYEFPVSTSYYGHYSSSRNDATQCFPNNSGANASIGFSFFFGGVATLAHLLLFICYAIFDCCDHRMGAGLHKAVFSLSLIAAISQFFFFTVPFAVMTNMGATEIDYGVWFALVLLLCAVALVPAAYYYKGGKECPPPAPKAVRQPTIVIMQRNGTGQVVAAPSQGIVQSSPVLVHQGTSSPVLVHQGTSTFTLLVHGVGTYPVKAVVQASTLPELEDALRAQLPIQSQKFHVLYTDADFHRTVQVVSLNTLPSQAEVTLQFY